MAMQISSMLDWLRVSQALDSVSRDHRRLTLPREPQVERSRFGHGPGLYNVVLQDTPPARRAAAADLQIRVHPC